MNKPSYFYTLLSPQKIFNSVAAVKNLTAESAPGAVYLTWEEPTEDNFSYYSFCIYEIQYVYSLRILT